MSSTGTTIPDGRSIRRDASPVEVRQLTRRGVLAVWAAATVPMGLAAWVVPPLLTDGSSARIQAMILGTTAGLVWQGVLVLLLVVVDGGMGPWQLYDPESVKDLPASGTNCHW